MRKKISVALIIMGAMLLLSALALVLFNVNKANECAEMSATVLLEMKKSIPEEFVVDKEQENVQQIVSGETDNIPEEIEYIEIDGNKFIGFLRIEKIGLELPVMADWSYDKMDISPCVYKGSLEEGNLIVMAHNYSGFFLDLDELSSGDIVEFVMCSGEVRRFEVDYLETIGGWNGEALKKGSDNWDLTLLTCTYSGYSRVVVRTIEVY